MSRGELVQVGPVAGHAHSGLDSRPMGGGFAAGVEPVAKAIRLVIGGRGKKLADVRRAAGVDIYRLLDGRRGLHVVHLVEIARGLGYSDVGPMLADVAEAMGRSGPKEEPQSPKARPPAEGATIPLDLHEAALRALQEAQARLAAYAGHSEIADDDIGPDTGRGGSTRPEPEPPGQGSGSNAGHPPPRRKKKP